MKHEDIYHIQSNQVRFADTALKTLLRKYRDHAFQRPISQRSRQQYTQLLARLQQHPRPIILDSGCGRGRSSLLLAKYYPHHWIVAVDQSADRLVALPIHTLDNLIIIQENCIDLWRLLAEHRLEIAMHMLLYPNPWPKKQHEKRRWYAHPIMPTLLKLSRLTIVRSNWLAYLESMASVAMHYGYHSHLSLIAPADQALTHFEAKYFHHGTRVYQLSIQAATV